MDELFNQVRNTFDATEQDKVLQKIHEKYVNEALFLMVPHDVNARAMSKNVKGLVQAQNWFHDFSPITLPTSDPAAAPVSAGPAAAFCSSAFPKAACPDAALTPQATAL